MSPNGTIRFIALDPATYRAEAVAHQSPHGTVYHYEALSDHGRPNFCLSADGTVGAVEAGHPYPLAGVIYTLEDLVAHHAPSRVISETAPSGA